MAKLVSAQLWWSVAGIATVYLAYMIKQNIKQAASRRRLAAAHGCQPPFEYPRRRYLFGLDCLGFKDLYLPNLWDMVHERCLKYNNTFHLQIVGAHVFETNEPENIKSILATQFKDFSLSWRQKIMTSFLGKGIFVTDGEEWRHLRSLLRPQFAREHVDDLPTFEKHVARLLAALPDDGSTVDLEPFFFKLTLDATTEFLFGRSSNSLAPDQTEDDKRFADAINEALDGLGNPLRYGLWVALLPDRTYSRACKYVRSTVDDLVHQARERHLAQESDTKSESKPDATTSNEHYNVLSALVATPGATPTEISDNLLNLLLAGRDTTATLLTNTLHALTQPTPSAGTALSTLRSSLNTISSPPTYNELKNASYLRYTLSESLRLFPPVPSNARVAKTDLVLPRGGGPSGLAPVLVPKSTFIIWHIFSTHRREDLWGDDAAIFRPERWDSPDCRPAWQHLPFNGGPRVCLGQQFALVQASYVISRLLQHFGKVEGRDDEAWSPRLAGTLLSRHGAKVALSQ